MKKKLLSLALALCMVLAILPTAALAAKAKVGDTTVVAEGGTYTLSNPIIRIEPVPDNIVEEIGDRSYEGAYVVPAGTIITNSAGEVEYICSDGIGTPPELEIQAGYYYPVWDSPFLVFYGSDEADITPDQPVTPPSSSDDFEIDSKGVLVTYKGKGGNVVIPAGVTGIGDSAFSGCPITSVTIPDSVTIIESSAFRGCTELTDISMGKGITSIGVYAFASCSSLTNVVIPDSVTSIGYHVFDGCVRLTNVNIPSGVTLQENMFYYCPALTNIVIPDGVVKIAYGMFYGCTGLTSVTIPSSVTEIRENAFNSCDSLNDIYYGGTEAQWKSIAIEGGNDNLTFATIHYNSTTPETPNLPTVEQIPAAGTAVARTQAVKLDGRDVQFQCYAVKDVKGNETNYVKIRDLASALNGTKAQFDVGWDGKISITSNTAYKAVGGEGATPYSGDQPYTAVSDTPVSFNGSPVNLTSFQLKDSAGNGYTYYKLRDLGQLLGFNVTWNGGVIIETDKPYSG